MNNEAIKNLEDAIDACALARNLASRKGSDAIVLLLNTIRHSHRQALALLRQPKCKICGGSGEQRLLGRPYDEFHIKEYGTCISCKGTGIMKDIKKPPEPSIDKLPISCSDYQQQPEAAYQAGALREAAVENKSQITEIERLKEEVKKRDGVLSVMGQITDRLELLTGEPNVWKAMRQLEAKLKDKDAKIERCRWIPVSEKLPEMLKWGEVLQSEWLHVTDGEKVVDAYYYDATEREAKPNYATGKGWYCHGIKKSEITHWKPIILPEQALKRKEE